MMLRSAFRVCSRAVNIPLCAAVAAGAAACSSTYRATDGAAAANVFTWTDTDADGILDPHEQPLPWVTTSIGYPDFLTATDGWAQPSLFKPGCARSCWRGETVSVKVPPGYVPTTPEQLPLTADNQTYYFGFRPTNERALPQFLNEPSWYLAFVHRGAKVASFHYSNNGELLISLEQPPHSDDYYPDEYEHERFLDIYFIDIVLELVDRHDVPLYTVNLIMPPSADTISCSVSTLEEWDRKLPGAEIVADYCAHQ